MASGALGIAQRTLGETGTDTGGSASFAHMLGLDDAVERANRLARLMDDDAPLGRALAPNGPLDRLLRPGGVIDQVTTEGGLLDRLTAENGAVSRALAPGGIVDQVTAEGGLLDRMTTDDGALSRVIAPGGLADQLLANDGLIERVLREDGVADKLLAEGGLLDTLTDENGPLLKLADVADTSEPVDAGAGGVGADDRCAARRRHHPEPGGQPAEQHRRPDSVAGPAAEGARPGGDVADGDVAADHRRRRVTSALGFDARDQVGDVVGAGGWPSDCHC